MTKILVKVVKLLNITVIQSVNYIIHKNKLYFFLINVMVSCIIDIVFNCKERQTKRPILQ